MLGVIQFLNDTNPGRFGWVLDQLEAEIDAERHRLTQIHDYAALNHLNEIDGYVKELRLDYELVMSELDEYTAENCPPIVDEMGAYDEKA